MSTYFVLYPKLSTNSKRALARKNRRFGHPLYYRARFHLVQRLMAEMGWTESEVRNQLAKEREELLKQRAISLGETSSNP